MISFKVVANVMGLHEFLIHVFLAQQMILIHSLEFDVRVAAAEIEYPRSRT